MDPINISFFPASLANGATSGASAALERENTLDELCHFTATEPQAERAPMALAALSEQQTERWSDSGPTTAVSHGSFSGRQGPTLTFISTCVNVTDLSAIRQLTFGLYQELLEAMGALGVPRFVRIWNYIPAINEGDGDNECYRQFCWGRADALADVALPAATGIGSRDGWLRISALCAGPADAPDSIGIRHIENARQLSAYQYPKKYGPRSPSFARATLVSPPAAPTTTDRASLLLVSGTSSIVHHQTLHAGNIEAQTAETLRNIQALFKSVTSDSATSPKTDALELTEPTPLALRYYLRSASNLAAARASWTANAGHWPAPAWYAGDICRSDLAMEVEGVFSV